jgi:hypothetical protein
MPKRWNRGAGRLSPPAVVFALLVLATLAAFAYAQRLKRDPLVVDRVTFVAAPVPAEKQKRVHNSFTPNGDCVNDEVRIRFRTTVSDHADVQIVKPSGRVVLTLAREAFLKRYTYHVYLWNGAQRGGGTAPPGRYKLRVKLLGEGRTLVPPGTIRLHAPPPASQGKSRGESCSIAIPKDQGAGLGRAS